MDDRGRIFFFELDDQLDPVGAPQLFVEGVGNGWHDGLGMDVCGNLWAADYETSSLYRVSNEGEIKVMVDWSDDPDQFGHGLVWGSGEGGWRDDALYVPVPAGGSLVHEVIVGVPAAVLPDRR
ncbi:MAG: SMP-30/gluconolactonase/LRE family protein [Proteobacteria bacterium]|nr:SMP-30/gluconolactonase/LRE family protein [Pseudomonadota bacterium]